MTGAMTRDEVERIVCEAREVGQVPDLRGLDLRGVGLSGAGLRVSDLDGANLSAADLHSAVLCSASLCDATLKDANLSHANLSHADFRGASLRRASLRYADMRYADLTAADLRTVDLRGAHLSNSRGVVQLGETPSGSAWMVPTVDGWRISIGCWREKSLDDLYVLLDAPDDHWPEARGAERLAREAILYALFKYAEAQAVYRQAWLDAVIEKWGEKEEDA